MNQVVPEPHLAVPNHLQILHLACTTHQQGHWVDDWSTARVAPWMILGVIVKPIQLIQCISAQVFVPKFEGWFSSAIFLIAIWTAHWCATVAGGLWATDGASLIEPQARTSCTSWIQDVPRTLR